MSAQTRGETTRCALTLPQAMADGKSLGSRSQTWWPAPWMASVDAVCQAQVGKTKNGYHDERSITAPQVAPENI